jgi:hypothetical protein
LHVSEDAGNVGVCAGKAKEYPSIADGDRGVECGLYDALVGGDHKLVVRNGNAHHAKAYDGKDSLEHDNWCANNVFVTEVSESESKEDGGEIRRRHEQLCIDLAEPHTDENDGQKVGKRIGASRCGAEKDSECPELGGKEVADELLPSPMIHLDISTVFLEALDDEPCLIRS